MTTLLKNASYLKVSHSGQTTGSLLLADLADEENAKQEKKIPVYVPENGSITIPLDEDVLLSYQQGTIRGLEDQGFITTKLFASRETAEIWVAPDGDDSNSGTINAPYASIQKAVDDLWEEHGYEVEKIVRLKSGLYSESVFLNRYNTTIEASPFNREPMSARIKSPDDRPSVIYTNMSKEAFDTFWADGGLQFTEGGGTFTYNGAQVTDREIVNTVGDIAPDNDNLNITIRGVDIDDATNALNGVNFAVVGIGVPPTGETDVALTGLYLDNSFVFGMTWLKNLWLTRIKGRLYDTILDNTVATKHYVNDSADFENDLFSGATNIVRYDHSNEAVEGSNQFSSYLIAGTGRGFFLTGGSTSFYCPTAGLELDVYGGTSYVFHAQADFYGQMELQSVVDADGGKPDVLHFADGFTLNDSVTMNVWRVNTVDFIKDSTGDLFVGELNATGNVTINAGTVNTIRGGTIEGNLTVDGAANLDLANVVVLGDVTINSGAGTVTWSGGSFHGTLTDPDSKLGAPASGSYLNV